MKCYREGGCGPYEYLSCSECPASKRSYLSKEHKCEFCEGGKPLAIGKTNDQGIDINYPNRLVAYGYCVHGMDSNALAVSINYCPMCGKKLAKENIVYRKI